MDLIKLTAMKMNILILLSASLPLVMCSPKVTPDEQKPGPETPEVKPPVEPVEGPVQKSITLSSFQDLNKGEEDLNNHAGLTERSSIKMIKSSYTEIPVNTLRVSFPAYPRISVLPDGSFFLTYQEAVSSKDGNGRSIHYAKSTNLKDWEWGGYMWKQERVTNGLGNADSRDYTNANSKVLSDGRLMVIGSFRNVSSYTHEDMKQDHGMKVKFSRDGGSTWEDEAQIMWWPNWEGDIIEQENGELQVYFADPRPWISGSNSGTSMILSKDGGKTWLPGKGEAPHAVMRSQYYSEAKARNLFTDQMPVGVILNGTKQMAFAMEVVKSYTSSKILHGISIVYSPEDGNWKYLARDTGVASLKRLDGLDDNSDGIGPYLVQFHSGETVLVYTKGNNSKLFARVGDEKAANFLPEGIDPIFPKYGGWAGAKIESGHTMLVVNKFSQDGSRGIAVARFALNHDITASSRTAGIDADNSEWQASDEAVCLSATETNEATLRISADENYVYLLAEVTDDNLAKSDKITLTLSAPISGDILPKGAKRFVLTPEGLISATSYASGKWNEYESVAVACSAYDGSLDSDADSDKGWFTEVRIPKEELLIKDGKISLNAELYDTAPHKSDNLKRKIYVSGL